MSRLYILEGPDCCGKTTLAKAFAWGRPRTAYFHSTASPALFPALMDYHQNILDNVKVNLENGLDVILDRFWPSEYVYGLNMFRPHSGYNPTQFQKQVTELGGLYVFCFSSTGLKEYKKGHQDPAHSLNDEQYRTIYNYYKMCYEQLKAVAPSSVVLYDLQHDGGNVKAYVQKLYQYGK